ncbi:MAG: N-acetylmuramoyl-L-alanine amidase [Gemmatimonadota bacterium]
MTRARQNAYLGTFVAVLAAIGMQGSADPTETPRALEETSSATAADLTPGAKAAVPMTTLEMAEAPLRAAPMPTTPPLDEALDTPQAVVEAVTAEPVPDQRRSRRRWRNRYPGPIPTPADWQPPEGPVKIALQAGHWRANEAPDELRGLRDNGTRWRDVAEWEANLRIAERSAEMLRELGYEAEVLPAVVPPGYRAHLFIAIHADGAGDPRASGYRVAAPRRDATGRAAGIVSLLEESYGEETGLRRLPDVTRRMSNYYAFNYRRYEHALHPMTIALILETGFITSERDRAVILSDPDRAARGIVAAVTRFEETPPPLATVVTDGAALAGPGGAR